MGRQRPAGLHRLPARVVGRVPDLHPRAGSPGAARRAPGLDADDHASSRLPDDAMGELLDGLVPGCPSELVAQIRRRAEGVPLYAVETVRMLLDRGSARAGGRALRVTGDVGDLEVPETLHALVAARLDNLDATERVAAPGRRGDRPIVLRRPRSPRSGAGSRRGAARCSTDWSPSRCSLHRRLRVGERGQYAFLQALLRQVALGTLSRRDRKARHLAAAEHLRTPGGMRPRSPRCSPATTSRRSTPNPTPPTPKRSAPLACQTLADAGRRALSLALGTEARRYFERAAELADDRAARARLLAEAGPPQREPRTRRRPGAARRCHHRARRLRTHG